MSNNNTTEATSADITPPNAPTKYPPGIDSFKKCETDPNLGHLSQVAVNLLLVVKEQELMLIPPKSRDLAKKWGKAMDVLFDGHDGQGDGVLSGYKKWTQANSALGKLKPLCIGIVEYFSGSCEDKVKGGEDLSALEEIAVVLNRDKEVAAREKELEKDAKLARRIQNEEAEAANGFRTAGNGVGHPSNVPMGPGEVHGLSLLGRATNSSRESNAIAGAAASAAARAVVIDTTRSRAHQEAELAERAAKRTKTDTITIHEARNKDYVDLTDGLTDALTGATRDMASIFRGVMSASPGTKHMRQAKANQELINLTIEEIAKLNNNNSGGIFDDEIARAKAHLFNLQQQRISATAVPTNLAQDMNGAGH